MKLIEESMTCNDLLILFRKYNISKKDQYKIIDLITSLYDNKFKQELELELYRDGDTTIKGDK